MCLFFFFFDQQFITWHAKIDCGSYFITTYRENMLTRGDKLKEREEREKGKRGTNRQRRRKIERKPSSTWCNTLIVCKCESTRIGDQEHSKMTQQISSRVPIPIESSTLMKNVSPWFNRIDVIRILEVFVGEKS